MKNAEKQKERVHLAREMCVLAESLSDWAAIMSESNNVDWQGIDGAEMYLKRIAADIENDPGIDTDDIVPELYGLRDLLGNCAIVLEKQEIESSVLRAAQYHLERVAVDLYRLDGEPPVDELASMADMLSGLSSGSMSLLLQCLSINLKQKWLQERRQANAESAR